MPTKKVMREDVGAEPLDRLPAFLEVLSGVSETNRTEIRRVVLAERRELAKHRLTIAEMNDVLAAYREGVANSFGKEHAAIDSLHLKPAESPAVRLPAFLDRLAARNPKTQASSIWGVVMAEKSTIASFGYTIATTRRALTDYRNAILDRFGEKHPAYNLMRLNMDDMEELRGSYKETIVGQHGSQRPVDLEAMIDAATEVLEAAESAHPMRVALALQLVTGRRVAETLLTATFAKSKKPNTLIFAGQLKTAGAESAQTEPYEIPVLADPDLIRSALRTLRERANVADLLDPIAYPRIEDAARKMHGRFSKVLSKEIRDLFTDADGGALTAKDLRAIYATAAYTYFAPKTVTIVRYFAKILGHSEGDLTTALSYEKFYPKGQKRAFASDLKWSLEAAIAKNEDDLDDESDPTQRGYIEDRLNTLRAALDLA
jgi:hypothetical protein